MKRLVFGLAQRKRPLCLHPSFLLVPDPSNRRNFSSSSKQEQQQRQRQQLDDLRNEATSIIDIPFGEINDWDHVEKIIRQTCKTSNSLELSFQILDRISQEHSTDNSFHPLNTVVYNWRRQYSKNSSTVLSPQHLVEKINSWRDALQPDAKTYTMIIEASKDLEFVEHLLEWMLEESKEHFLLQPTTVTFASVMHAWANSGRPDAPYKIEGWIETMKTLHREGWPDVAPNIVVYNIYLNSLSKTGNVLHSEQLLQNMLSGDDDTVQPDRVTFTTLLTAYSRLGNQQSVDRARILLQQMHGLYEAGYDFAKPNMISYTIVMDCHAKLGQGEQAEALLKQLLQLYEKTLDSDFFADLSTYNTVLLAWARSNNPQRADRFLEFIYQEAPNVQPDERSFNIVLSAWAKAGAPKRAEEILTRMHELHQDGELDTRPTVVAYNTVLDAWSRSRNGEKACQRSAKVLNHMMELYKSEDKAVQPNERTWNTVLNCFAKAGQIERAKEYLEKFIQASKQNQVKGKPSIRTWNTLLAACLQRKDVGCAKKFWNQMKQADIQPDVVSYNTLLNCHARSRSKEQELEATFSQLLKDPNVKPNRISYLAVINFWINRGKIEKAETVLKNMCKNHAMNDMLPPDRELFHKVMGSWSDKKNARKAESLLFQMMELSAKHGFDLEPTVETYNRLLNAWAVSSEIHSGERADSILRQMESSDEVSPDIISYNSTLNAWANSGDKTGVTRIERLILEMILKGNPQLNPTVVSYGTWLKAIELSNEPDKGRRSSEVLKTMKIHKLEPTDFILKKVESLKDSK